MCSVCSIIEDDEIECGVFAIDSNKADEHFQLFVAICGTIMKVLCDTGAPCSLMCLKIFDALFDRNILRPCTLPLTGYGGDPLKILGEFTTDVSYKGQTVSGKFVVTMVDRPTLLGRDLLRMLGFELVQTSSPILDDSVNFVNSQTDIIAQIKSDFAELFKSGLGKYNVSTIKLPISKDANPIFCKPRTVPLAWREKIENQIASMVEQGMLIPVDDSD